MNTDTKYILSILVLLAIVLYCLIVVINALRRGYIRYSGNRPSMRSYLYTRKDQPFGFWAGVVAFSFPILLLLIGLIVGFFAG